jgi:hypothetical protein
MDNWGGIGLMIRWSYEQMDMFNYWLEIRGEYNELLYPKSIISSPAMTILREILLDYLFARLIDRTDRVFNYDGLSSEDKMDIKTLVIHKLEDID